MYKLLLRFQTEEVQIKDCMAKWTINFGFNIQMDSWERIWVNNIKFTNLHCVITEKKSFIN